MTPVRAKFNFEFIRHIFIILSPASLNRVYQNCGHGPDHKTITYCIRINIIIFRKYFKTVNVKCRQNWFSSREKIHTAISECATL